MQNTLEGLMSVEEIVQQTTFEDLGISEDILQALLKKGYTHPTPIQAQTIPMLLHSDKDIIGQAQTGTGKTAAFGIPIIEKIQQGKRKVQALVLTPTRELCVQVMEEMVSFKGKRNIHILPVYGGQGMDYQLKRLREGVDIVVGTPGRVIDHMNRGTLNLSEVQYIVLDEADEMLNMGFAEDVESILKHVPEKRQMLLFSATMPDRIRQIAETYMGNYDMIKAAKTQEAAPKIEQIYYEVYGEDKFKALCRLIDTEKEFYALIFCRTKSGTDELGNNLIDKGYAVETLHGDVSQHVREQIMRKFKTKRSTILVATDVAARGIDVNDLSHVINYDLPQDPETYTHRIGRTGRAGKTGKAITLITPAENRKISFISHITKMSIRKGKLPKAEDAVELKRIAIFEEMTELISKEDYTDFSSIAEQILEFNDPQLAISALLKKAYGDVLQLNHHDDIREPFSRGDGGKNSGAKLEKRGDKKPGDRGNDRDRGSFRDRERSGGADRNREGSFRDRDRDRGVYDRERSSSFEKKPVSRDEKGTFEKKRPFDKEVVKEKSIKPSRDKKGYELLFFAKGSKDGITNSIFKEFIKDETGVASHKIYEVDIYPKHTLFRVTADAVDGILKQFGGERPVVRRDKK